MTRGFFSLTVTSKWATLLHDISMGQCLLFKFSFYIDHHYGFYLCLQLLTLHYTLDPIHNSQIRCCMGQLWVSQQQLYAFHTLVHALHCLMLAQQVLRRYGTKGPSTADFLWIKNIFCFDSSVSYCFSTALGSTQSFCCFIASMKLWQGTINSCLFLSMNLFCFYNASITLLAIVLSLQQVLPVILLFHSLYAVMVWDYQQLTSLEYDSLCFYNAVRDCFQNYNDYYVLIRMFSKPLCSLVIILIIKNK